MGVRMTTEETPPPAEEMRILFADEMAGRRATCEGGAQSSAGSPVGGRETFVGTLSGRRMEYGDPPWKWLELVEITEGPEGFAEDHVWCDESFVFLHDEPDR